MNYSQTQKVRELYEEALKIHPLSLTARWYFISSILPRWGGNISEIEKEIFLARPYYIKNPALKILEGRLDAELGDQAFFRKDYASAEKHYTEALKYGEHWYYNGQRGDVYSYLGLMDKSNTDLNTALRLRPNFERAILVIASNKYSNGQYDEAIPFLSQIINDNPGDHKRLDLRGDCYRRIGNLSLAKADFEAALTLDPTNSEYLADRELVRKLMPISH